MTDGDAGSVSESSKRIAKKRDQRISCIVCGQLTNKSNMARNLKRHNVGATKSADGLSKANDSVQIIDVSVVRLILSDILKLLVPF